MQYLRIRFTNIEPLRIADDSTSYSGQTTTLKYIPGSTIRGIVLNRLAASGKLDAYKKELFSDSVRFLNAYPVKDEKALIPSLKGFYEDKSGSGTLKNVLIEDIDGLKRAALGRFCSYEGNTIEYYNVDLCSDMRNKIMLEQGEKQNVFRYEYMMPGYEFEAYIAYESDEMQKIVSDAIEDEFIIGNARSVGLGKCEVIKKEITGELPYSKYSVCENVNGTAYMALLSDTTMRNANGEYCGIDAEKLGKLLGVNNLGIEACSTSTVNIKGYNRKIGTKMPSVTMYEKGSVFKLSFDGEMHTDNINAVQHNGIGVRKNEGFGRVLFIKDYENITAKVEGKLSKKIVGGIDAMPEDKALLKLIAGNHYRNIIDKAIMATVVSNPLRKGTISSSQVGALETQIVANRYDYSSAVASINEYYDHALDKEEKAKIQKDRNSIRQIKDFVLGVLSTSMEEVLGLTDTKTILGIDVDTLLSDEEKGRYKLQYILDAIHYDNRKGGN